MDNLGARITLNKLGIDNELLAHFLAHYLSPVLSLDLSYPMKRI